MDASDVFRNFPNHHQVEQADVRHRYRHRSDIAQEQNVRSARDHHSEPFSNSVTNTRQNGDHLKGEYCEYNKNSPRLKATERQERTTINSHREHGRSNRSEDTNDWQNTDFHGKDQKLPPPDGGRLLPTTGDDRLSVSSTHTEILLMCGPDKHTSHADDFYFFINENIENGEKENIPDFRNENKLEDKQEKVDKVNEQNITESKQEKNNKVRKENILEGREEKILEARKENILEGKEEKILEARKENIVMGNEEKILEARKENIVMVNEEKILEARKENILEGKEEKIRIARKENILESKQEKIREVKKENILEGKEEKIPDVNKENILEGKLEKKPEVRKENILKRKEEKLSEARKENILEGKEEKKSEVNKENILEGKEEKAQEARKEDLLRDKRKDVPQVNKKNLLEGIMKTIQEGEKENILEKRKNLADDKKENIPYDEKRNLVEDKKEKILEGIKKYIRGSKCENIPEDEKKNTPQNIKEEILEGKMGNISVDIEPAACKSNILYSRLCPSISASMEKATASQVRHATLCKNQLRIEAPADGKREDSLEKSVNTCPDEEVLEHLSETIHRQCESQSEGFRRSGKNCLGEVSTQPEVLPLQLALSVKMAHECQDTVNQNMEVLTVSLKSPPAGFPKVVETTSIHNQGDDFTETHNIKSETNLQDSVKYCHGKDMQLAHTHDSARKMTVPRKGSYSCGESSLKTEQSQNGNCKFLTVKDSEKTRNYQHEHPGSDGQNTDFETIAHQLHKMLPEPSTRPKVTRNEDINKNTCSVGNQKAENLKVRVGEQGNRLKLICPCQVYSTELEYIPVTCPANDQSGDINVERVDREGNIVLTCPCKVHSKMEDCPLKCSAHDETTERVDREGNIVLTCPCKVHSKMEDCPLKCSAHDETIERRDREGNIVLTCPCKVHSKMEDCPLKCSAHDETTERRDREGKRVLTCPCQRYSTKCTSESIKNDLEDEHNLVTCHGNQHSEDKKVERQGETVICSFNMQSKVEYCPVKYPAVEHSVDEAVESVDRKEKDRLPCPCQMYLSKFVAEYKSNELRDEHNQYNPVKCPGNKHSTNEKTEIEEKKVLTCPCKVFSTEFVSESNNKEQFLVKCNDNQQPMSKKVETAVREEESGLGRREAPHSEKVSLNREHYVVPVKENEFIGNIRENETKGSAGQNSGNEDRRLVTESLGTKSRHILRQLEMAQSCKRQANDLLKNVQSIIDGAVRLVSPTEQATPSEAAKEVTQQSHADPLKHENKSRPKSVGQIPCQSHNQQSHKKSVSRSSKQSRNVKEHHRTSKPDWKSKMSENRDSVDRAHLKSPTDTHMRHTRCSLEGNCDNSVLQLMRSVKPNHTAEGVGEDFFLTLAGKHNRDNKCHFSPSEAMLVQKHEECVRIQRPCSCCQSDRQKCERSARRQSKPAAVYENRAQSRRAKSGQGHYQPTTDTSECSYSVCLYSEGSPIRHMINRRSCEEDEDLYHIMTSKGMHCPSRSCGNSPIGYIIEHSPKYQHTRTVKAKQNKFNRCSYLHSLEEAIQNAKESISEAAKVAKVLNYVANDSSDSSVTAESEHADYPQYHSKPDVKKPDVQKLIRADKGTKLKTRGSAVSDSSQLHCSKCRHMKQERLGNNIHRHIEPPAYVGGNKKRSIKCQTMKEGIKPTLTSCTKGEILARDPTKTCHDGYQLLVNTSSPASTIMHTVTLGPMLITECSPQTWNSLSSSVKSKSCPDPIITISPKLLQLQSIRCAVEALRHRQGKAAKNVCLKLGHNDKNSQPKTTLGSEQSSQIKSSKAEMTQTHVCCNVITKTNSNAKEVPRVTQSTLQDSHISAEQTSHRHVIGSRACGTADTAVCDSVKFNEDVNKSTTYKKPSRNEHPFSPIHKAKQTNKEEKQSTKKLYHSQNVYQNLPEQQSNFLKAHSKERHLPHIELQCSTWQNGDSLKQPEDESHLSQNDRGMSLDQNDSLTTPSKSPYLSQITKHPLAKKRGDSLKQSPEKRYVSENLHTFITLYKDDCTNKSPEERYMSPYEHMHSLKASSKEPYLSCKTYQPLSRQQRDSSKQFTKHPNLLHKEHQGMVGDSFKHEQSKYPSEMILDQHVDRRTDFLETPARPISSPCKHRRSGTNEDCDATQRGHLYHSKKQHKDK